MNTAPKKYSWVSWFYPFPAHCVILNRLFCRLAIASLALLAVLPLYWFFFPDLWEGWVTEGQTLYWMLIAVISAAECSDVWISRLKISLFRRHCSKKKMHDLYFRQQVRQLIIQERGVVYFSDYLIDGEFTRKHFLFLYWEFKWGRFLTFREPWKVYVVMHEDKDCASIFSRDTSSDFHLELARHLPSIKMADAHVCGRAISIDYDHPAVP